MDAREVCEGLKLVLEGATDEDWSSAMGPSEPVSVGDDLACDRSLILRFGDEEFKIVVKKAK